MDRSNCGSCRKAIVWAVSAKGKAQPFDATPERRVINAILPPPDIKAEKRSVITYDAAGGEWRAIVVDTWPLGAPGVVGAEQDVYMPHHATCPFAARYRGGK